MTTAPLTIVFSSWAPQAMARKTGALTALGQKPMPPWFFSLIGGVCLAASLALPWMANALGWLSPAAEVAEGGPPELRPELIELPGGTFTMGSPESEPGRNDDELQHEVTVSPFAICQTEVTQGQYEAVMGSNPSNCRYGCGPDRPVQNVSWYEAVGFLNALSKRQGLSPCYEINGEYVRWLNHNCFGYRLPTEAEWEYAARAGTTTRFSFGDYEASLGEHAWYRTNSDQKMHPVGTKQANAWGLYDVHGNVWEWVWDKMGSYEGRAATNPVGPSKGYFRVLRGGSLEEPRLLRSANRSGNTPKLAYKLYGFRCVRGPAPSLDR